MAPNPSKFKAPIITPTSSAGSSQSSDNGRQNNSERKREKHESSTGAVKSPKQKKQRTEVKKTIASTISGEQKTSVEKHDEESPNSGSSRSETQTSTSSVAKSTGNDQKNSDKKKKEPLAKRAESCNSNSPSLPSTSKSSENKKPKMLSISLTDEEYDRIFKSAIGNDTGAVLNKDSEDMFSFSQSDLEELEEDEDNTNDTQDKGDKSEKIQSSPTQAISFDNSENRDPKNCANIRAADGTEEGDEDVIPSSQVILPLNRNFTSRKPLAPIHNSTLFGGGNNIPLETFSCDLSVIKIEPSPSITYMAELPSSQPLNGSQQTEMATDSTSHTSGAVQTSSSGSKEPTKKSSQKSDSEMCKDSASQKNNSLSQSLKPTLTQAAPAVPLGSHGSKKKIGVPSAPMSSQGSSTQSQSLSQLSNHVTGSHPTSENQSQGFNLSLPQPKLPQRERLRWLQERRAVGLWVQCDHKTCGRWRYLSDVHDPTTLPDKWYCSMHPDENFNTCAAPEKRFSILQEEDMIFNTYTAGSLVWARLTGYPWWPAMVDDDPDVEQFYWLNEFSDIPTWYHVVFLEEKRKISRAWVATEHLRPFKGPEDEKFFMVHQSDYKKRIEGACRLACDMQKYDILERLRRYSFISLFKGPIGTQSRKKYSVEDDEKTSHCNAATQESVSQGAERE